MKIVVIGGSGLIGKRIVNTLRTRGHQVVAPSPTFGVNTLSGEGLVEALAGASVVVDVSNPSSFEIATAMNFFETSTRNLLVYEAAAGVGHHVALSVVGLERLPEYGYFRAKLVQENLIKASSIPYSIIRATQFFDFLGRIADEVTEGNTVRLSSALLQPMAADDVAGALAMVSVGTPVNGTVEIAGPEQFHLDEVNWQGLTALNDSRMVISKPRGCYFGEALNEKTLVPDKDAQLSETRFDSWLSQHANQRPNKSHQPPAGTSRREHVSGKSTTMVALAVLVACILAISGSLIAQAKAEETITPLLTNDLAGVAGKEVLMYTVDFPPGFSSPIHRHNAQVSVYVLEGSVVMQVRGGKEVTLGPGQSFYESPNDIHIVSRNASSTKPAKFLVSLIHEKGAPLVIPAK